jgi:hypothetical protein
VDHLWPVEVVDEKGAAVTGVKVALVEKSKVGVETFPYPGVAATHDDKGGGKYEPKAALTPSAGKWLLVVTKKGRAPVVQPLTLTDKKADGFVAGGSELATVTLTTALRTVGASKQRETRFRVVLHPPAELVFLGGIDYHKRDPSTGWLFHLYGFKRAEVLWREKKIHAGTVVTVFSTSHLTRTTRVRGKKGWIDVEVHPIRDRALRVIPAAGHYTPVVGIDYHPQEFYKYLSEVGTREPKSVREAGIFSHSYPGGPILYNTYETGFEQLPARAPDDFDARAKDWNATNVPGYPKLKDAFASDARFTIWGCSATLWYRRRAQAATKAMKAGKGENDRFLVEVDLGGTGKLEEQITELELRWWMDTLFRKGPYCAEAARYLGIETRSACPGVGSDPETVDGIEMLMVKMENHEPEYAYYRKKFGPEFAETNGKWDKGYVDYHAVQQRPAVPSPPFDPAYYAFQVQAGEDTVLMFWNRKKVIHPGSDVKLKRKLVPDLVTAGKTGWLYVLEDTDTTKSQAVYAQEDARIFAITRDGASKWTVKGAELP